MNFVAFGNKRSVCNREVSILWRCWHYTCRDCMNFASFRTKKSVCNRETFIGKGSPACSREIN